MKLLRVCLTMFLGVLLPPAAWAQVSVSISIAPPPLLLYAQPSVPGEGYIWVPGYWGWSDPDRGYYWVPGTWVLAPNEGDLWTPGYWAFENARYFWHIGYWGPRVGFYGGINYGYGYSGSGYQGGRWDHGAFQYNRAVSNVNAQIIHNAYGTPALSHQGGNRISFNGGTAGARAMPTASERRFQSAEHPGPRTDQVDHEAAARSIATQRAAGPHGVPQVAATPRPSEYAAPNVEHVRAAPAGSPGRAAPVQGEANSARRPAPEPRRAQQPVVPQPRAEVPPASRVQPSRPEQRGPRVRLDPPDQEGQPRKER